MSSLDDLGRALRADAAANAPRAADIDVDAVVRASRARRQPRQWALGAVVVVAAAGIGGASIAAVTSPPDLIAASEAADEASGDDVFSLESDGGSLPDSRVAQYDCLQPLGDVIETSAPLTLEVRFAPTTVIVDGEITGDVRMLNVGSSTVRITADMSPFVTLSQNGLVLWRTPLIGSAAIDRQLAPGDSIDFAVRLAAVVCDPASDGWPLNASGLQIVAPGEYDLSATIGVMVDDDASQQRLTSPRQTVRLE
ncbi:MAG: hypothetical protein KIT89_01450 [Microcella sp.]|uniref:hypothetical protein n=1 Tax=Microcella sp. TaxID=1913979 RepID=UPI0024C89F1F|nr:hypothetical protein [Microcella sp.]UYN83928.1 MAG: hypothetical protein KIT89_01450 [Microcella sp.]